MKGFFEKIRQNQFTIFIAGAVLISIFLIGISFWMYNEFGTAQLDLSRPSYQEAREQAKKEAQKNKKSAEEFPSDGEINKKALQEFDKIFSERLKNIDSDFYSEDALSDKTLNISVEGEN